VARAAGAALWAATLLVIVLTSRRGDAMRRPLAALLGGAGAAGAAVVVSGAASSLLYAVDAVIAAGAIAALVGGVARLVAERGVAPPAVLGALTIYLLIGLFFTFAMGALAAGGAGPYFQEGTDGTAAQRAYFSFVTLTTTGYGDLAPATGTGRALAVIEMLLGQLYLVTVVAILVGNLHRRRPG
jgi:hypothetical protein